MNRIHRRHVLSAALGAATCAALGLPAAALADEVPVRINVGFPPGGTTDVIARLVATSLGTEMNKPFIVDNKAGASGNIAASLVAKGPADGSNLLFAPSSHATNASLYKRLNFDTAKDFSAIGMVATTPYVLVVHPSIPAKNVAELVALLKANPDKYQYASASQGTGQHLAAELFKHMAGVQMEHIPYKGSAAAFPDLIAGRTPIMFDNVAVVMPHIRSGGVKALAVTSPRRSPLMPELPTVADTLKGYEIQGWFTLLAPSKLPAASRTELNARLNKVVRSPEFSRKLSELGAEPVTMDPAAADAYIAREISRWSEVIKQANIALD